MASAASRAVPALSLCGRMVTLGASVKPKSQLPGNCITQFLTQKSNHLARFVSGTKNVDKALKLAKSSSELGAHILDLAGQSGDVSCTLKNTAGAISTARSFIALTNAYNGAIPGFVSSVRNCYAHLKQCFSSSENEESQGEVPYNACYLDRKDHVLAAVDAFSLAVGASTYVATFGAVRPVLLANKLVNKPFLSAGAKQALGSSVDYMMTANHAARVVGGLASLAYESRAFSRANQTLDEAMQSENISGDAYEQMAGALKQSHVQNLKKIILNLLEKAFELLADIVKFLPLPHYSSLRLAAIAGFTTVSSAIGCYTLWTSS